MNVRLENVTLVDYDICPPTEIEREEEQFTTADVSTCGVPECAETYFEDLAQALNNVDNLAQGCSSGVQVFFLFPPIFLLRFKNFFFYLTSFEFF